MSETKPDLTLSLQETANSIEIQTEDGTIVADLINEADCCVTESMRQYAALFAAAPDMLAALKDLTAWLSLQREKNVITRSTGKGGHDGDGNSWAAVAIPEWDVRQKIDAIAAAIAKAGTQ